MEQFRVCGHGVLPAPLSTFVDKQGVSWTFRAAHAEDADQLAALYDAFGSADRSLGLPPAVDYRRRSWLRRLLSEGHNIVVEGPDLVGHVAYTPADDDRPELAVFVHSDFHNRGINTELCTHATAAAVNDDREALVLHVDRSNRAAVAVYRRIGFEVVDTDHSMQMELPIDEPIATTVCTSPTDRL